MLRCSRLLLALSGLGVLWGLTACSSSVPLNRAMVEDRPFAPAGSAAGAETRNVAVRMPPGFENAGKPGYYTVKPNDTIIRIGLETGQSHKDIIRWNTLQDPNRIEVGQVLRVVPPVAGAAVVAAPAGAAPAASAPVAVAKPVSSAVVTAAPVGAAVAKTGAAAAEPAAPAATPSASAAPAATPAPAAGTAVAGGAAAAGEKISLAWPSKGAVIAKYSEALKGIDIGGAEGDPVYAAADGKVILAEMGEATMARYGKLIIVKHGNYLTAYAHNHTMLVKEDEMVKKGQKIATMGSTGTDKVKLHFEVRYQGKPMDPMAYLPAK